MALSLCGRVNSTFALPLPSEEELPEYHGAGYGRQIKEETPELKVRRTCRSLPQRMYS